MPIDTTNIDLVALIEQRTGIRFIHKSTSAGGEWKGSCPFCDKGKDRFFIQPYAGRPHYHCRVCGRTGDAIAFLEEHEHLTFKQALVELELESEGFIEPKFRFYDDPPCKEWQNAAGDFIARAERYLWHPNAPESQKALEYLRGRGFTDETIKLAHLGYCPLTKEGKWFTDSLERWGLTQEQTGKDVVRIADGIVIPWISDGDVWKICIKRPWVEDPKTELVYGQVVGSAEGLYNSASILDARPAVLVEGEFDALSVVQESNLICVATGSASRGRTQRWISLLSQASLVLQSFDNDQAGDDGAAFWLEQLPNAIRWKPWKKDPNEMLCKGQPIGSWVELGLQSTQFAPEKVVEMPVSTQPVVYSSSAVGPSYNSVVSPEGSCKWHPRKPAYEQDITGMYCKRCWDERRFHQNQTIERAEKLGYPPFLDVSAGEIAWVEFVLEADDIKLGSVEGMLQVEIQGLNRHKMS